MEATESSRLVNFPESPCEHGARNSSSGGEGGRWSRLFQRLADRLQHQLLHDEIGVGVGVAAVGGEARQHLGRGLSADASAAVVVLAQRQFLPEDFRGEQSMQMICRVWEERIRT